MRKRPVSSTILKLALLAFFAAAVLLPLLRMLAYMRNTDVLKVLGGAAFRKACLNSLKVGLLTTAVSIPLAYALAWCVTRTHLRLRGLWSVLFSLPMLIPSISQGSGLIILFGANGVLTRLLHLGGNIYGLHGIVIGEAMYVTPIAFLMFADVLTYEDYTPYEAAQVLGIPRLRQFTAVTLPFLRRPLISAVFTVFSLTVTDYGVPLTIGGKVKTLPVLMYEDVIGLLDFGKGSVIGAVLLIPAVLAFLADLSNRDAGGNSFVARPFVIRQNKTRDGLACALCAAVGIFMLLPVAAFGVLSFMTNYPIDIHGFGDAYTDEHVKGIETDKPYFEIPYKALVVRDLDNMLVAGRCIGCDFFVQAAIRIMPTCRATGEAAGIAAAVCAAESLSPHDAIGVRVHEIMCTRGAEFVLGFRS